jgi:hypothetical protein
MESFDFTAWTAFIRAVLVGGLPADDLAESFGLPLSLTNEFVDLIIKSHSCFIENMAITLLQMKMAQGIAADIRVFVPEMAARVKDLEHDCLESFAHLLSPEAQEEESPRALICASARQAKSQNSMEYPRNAALRDSLMARIQRLAGITPTAHHVEPMGLDDKHRLRNPTGNSRIATRNMQGQCGTTKEAKLEEE